jgi:histidinol phosphatase-like PHP family hydrolase
MARERGIYLELSARKGHSLANGHVAKLALDVGASLVLNTDSHSPSDLITRKEAEHIARGAGLSQNACQAMFTEAEALARRLAEL